MPLVIPVEKCSCGQKATICTACAWRGIQVSMEAVFAASWERMVLLAALDRETSGGANEDVRRTRCASLMLTAMELHPPHEKWRIQNATRSLKAERTEPDA